MTDVLMTPPRPTIGVSTSELRVPERVSPARSTHPVRVARGSRLAGALGSHVAEINSLHHQAVDRLGEGLEAVAWAPDGVVEAVEGSGDAFLLGVQWHAEGLIERAGERRLLSAFIASAVERRAGAVAGPVA